jgi:hypothetical protein
MTTQNKPEKKESVSAGRRTITVSRRTALADGAAASGMKKAKANKPQAVADTKAGKQLRGAVRSLRVASEVRLVCRYCGGDDLAPSFVKRRDARCRACFKQRYGSAAQNLKASRPRKTKAAK